MRPRGPIECAIYATTYTTRLGNELARGNPTRTTGPGALSDAEWQEWCIEVAIGAGEIAVKMHRDGMRRRRP